MPKTTVPFELAQSSIKTGDIVFIGGAKSLIAWLIQAVTRSSYSHVGIACWMYDHHDLLPSLFLVEAYPSGRRLVSLSYYGLKRPMTVIEAPVPWATYRQRLLERTGLMPYGYLDLIGIAFKELFRISTKDFDGEVCSEMVATVLNNGGMNIDKLVSPGRLHDILRERGCAVRVVTTPK